MVVLFSKIRGIGIVKTFIAILVAAERTRARPRNTRTRARRRRNGIGFWHKCIQGGVVTERRWYRFEWSFHTPSDDQVG